MDAQQVAETTDDPTIEGRTVLVFTLDTVEDDIISDLLAIGVNVRGVKEADAEVSVHQMLMDDAAQRAAVAATFLRRAGEEDAELARLRDAMMLQVELVTAHYDRLMLAPARRRDGYLRYVESLATEAMAAGDFGKKKSGSTPFGDFGVEDRKAGVQMSDPALLLAHLRDQSPEHVRVTATMPLAQAREYLSPTELEAAKMAPAWGDLKKTLDPSGALPPGVERIDARRVAFAKPFTPFTGVAAASATSTASVL